MDSRCDLRYFVQVSQLRDTNSLNQSYIKQLEEYADRVEADNDGLKQKVCVMMTR